MKKSHKNLETDLRADQNNQISQQEYFYYKKWLPYYIDFCSKCGHAPKISHSLPLFINRLSEKE